MSTMRNITPFIALVMLAVASCGQILPDMPVNMPLDVKEWVKSSEKGDNPGGMVTPTDTITPVDTATPVIPPIEPPVGPSDTTSTIDTVIPPVVPDIPTSITVDGIEYGIAKFADGRWWMTENLRRIPEGARLGEDIFYPCKDTENAPDETEEGIRRKGLLYSDRLAFGTEVTTSNYGTLEGAQGICPDGWHIPTVNEWMAMVGRSSKSDIYPTDPNAAYYAADLDSGSIELMENAGFHPVQCGYWRKGAAGGYLASYDKITMSYYYGSSVYTYISEKAGLQCQFLSLMLSGNNGKASVATHNSSLTTDPIAGSVRCIKNE